MPKRPRKRVAIIMHRWVGYLHGVQLGIAEYAVQKPEWICTHLLPDASGLNTLTTMPLDGVIAYVEPEYVGQLRACGAPVVDVSNWMLQQPFPRVVPDDYAIGKLAATYLMDLGLKQFGYRGYENAHFSRLRESGCVDVLKSAGLAVSVWDRSFKPDPRLKPPAGIDPSMLTWLMRLPKPAGIFCANDGLACDILELCRHARLRVPEEICIIGVDDDELLTKISHPPISSIALQTQKIGFEAARWLDQLMSGRKLTEQAMLLPPERVVARQSTNLLAIDDEYVLSALRYIREHIHERISVDDILDVVPVNRRFLERRFREHLGRTPLQEIRRVRIETAKQLLSGTDLAMPAIARRSGFPNPERLANVFHAVTGMTPTHYRRQFKLHDE
jgi:LacI family transcriptional regulator